MEQLVHDGKISDVGSSTFAAWDLALAQSAADHRNFLGLICEQSLSTWPSARSNWKSSRPHGIWPVGQSVVVSSQLSRPVVAVSAVASVGRSAWATR
jgi:hypothetical protein